MYKGGSHDSGARRWGERPRSVLGHPSFSLAIFVRHFHSPFVIGHPPSSLGPDLDRATEGLTWRPRPMSQGDGALRETITLGQAKSLIRGLAHEQSLLLLSPPGMGKSDTVVQAAT